MLPSEAMNRNRRGVLRTGPSAAIAMQVTRAQAIMVVGVAIGTCEGFRMLDFAGSQQELLIWVGLLPVESGGEEYWRTQFCVNMYLRREPNQVMQ